MKEVGVHQKESIRTEMKYKKDQYIHNLHCSFGRNANYDWKILNQPLAKLYPKVLQNQGMSIVDTKF